MASQVDKKYEEWLVNNRDATELQKVNYYNQCVQTVYNDLSYEDKKLVDEYMHELEK